MAAINMDIPETEKSEEWAASTANALSQAQTIPPSTLEQTQPEARGTAQFTTQAAATSTTSTPDVPGAFPAIGALGSGDAKAPLDRLSSHAEKQQEGTPYQVASEAVETVKQYLPAKEDVQRAVNAVSETAGKMAAQMGIPMDVTEPESADRKISQMPDVSTTASNATSTLGNTANVAVAGVASTLGTSTSTEAQTTHVPSSRPSEVPIPGSAMPSQSVMDAVNMDTPHLQSKTGADYITQAPEPMPVDSTPTTIGTTHVPTERPEAVHIPSSALPSQSVMDAVNMDTPKTEVVPKATPLGATTGAGAGGALEKSDSDFPLPSDSQVATGNKDNNAGEGISLKPGTKDGNDQPVLNVEPSPNNKHVMEGTGVGISEGTPMTGSTQTGTKGLEESSSGTSGVSESTDGGKEKKSGKAHRFMEKVKDKLHMH